MAITSGLLQLLNIQFASSSNLLWRPLALVYHMVSLSFGWFGLEVPLDPVWWVSPGLLFPSVALGRLSPDLLLPLFPLVVLYFEHLLFGCSVRFGDLFGDHPSVPRGPVTYCDCLKKQTMVYSLTECVLITSDMQMILFPWQTMKQAFKGLWISLWMLQQKKD